MDYSYHRYDQPDPPHQPLYLDIILRYLQAEPSISRVLDAGCGDGNFTASLAEAGFEMYGIDLSEGGIAKAKERYPRCQFHVGSVYDSGSKLFGVPFFDAIISVEVIEHLYSPRRFLQACHEALRPGGILILTTPYWGYFKNVMLALTGRIDKALTARWEGGHIKHWSYRTLRAALADARFEYVAFHGAGRPLPGFWKGMVLVARR